MCQKTLVRNERKESICYIQILPSVNSYNHIDGAIFNLRLKSMFLFFVGVIKYLFLG